MRILSWVAMLAALMASRAVANNALDTITFGDLGTDAASESAHQFTPGTGSYVPLAGIGALGQTFRALYDTSVSPPAFTFTMKCSPTQQNYLTLRLWGSDVTGAALAITGQAPVDGPIDFAPGPAFPNRFYYADVPIPLSMTQGHTSVALTLYEFSGGLPAAVPSRPVYSAYTHTDPCFFPDPGNTGVPLPQTGYVAPTVLTAAQISAILQTNRQNVFVNTGTASYPTDYFDGMLARQIPAGQPGAPEEVIGLDLLANVAAWTAAYPNATPDQWRDQASQGGGAGYSTMDDQMLTALTAAYLLPPFKDVNNNTVAGLDHYHDPAILQRIVACLDACSYMQSSDGSYNNNANNDANGVNASKVWQGVTSAARASGHAYAGSTSRGTGWSITLEGADTCTFGWVICELLNDPVAAPLLENYLTQSFDADLTGGSMMRAYAYERMLNNSVRYLTANDGNGTVSQGLFSITGMYCENVALQQLQALYPYNGGNSSAFPNDAYTYAMPYPALSEAGVVEYVKQIMGLEVCGSIMFNLYKNGMYPNYAISAAGLGEDQGTYGGGYDGRYGQVLPKWGGLIAEMGGLDPNLDPTTLAGLRQQARAAVDAFPPFISPLESVFGLSDQFTFAQEDYITQRDPYDPNANAGIFFVGSNYMASDSAKGVNSDLALRSAYLEALYGKSGPGLSHDIFSYEATLARLGDLPPASMKALPGEPGQPNSAWVDVQIGAVAAYYNGERFYMNSNWRNNNNGSTTLSYLARIHDTTPLVDRAALVFMPHDASTAQPDGNVSGGRGQPWVVRYGNWLIMGNPGTAAATLQIPNGRGNAKELVTGSNYAMGTVMPVPAGQAAVVYLSVPPTGATLADGTYTLANVGSLFLATDPSASGSGGTQMVQAAVDGTADQQWAFVHQGNGYYIVKNVASGLYLTNPGGSSGDGAPLQQQSYASSYNQLWQLIPNAGGYILLNQASGTAVTSADLVANSGLVLSASTNDKPSTWNIQPTTGVTVPFLSGTYTVTSGYSGLLLNNPGGAVVGTQMNQANATGGNEQAWFFNSNGNGYYTIANVLSGQYLTEAYGSTTNAAITQEPVTNDDTQLWQLFVDDAGLVIANKADGLALQSGNTSLGAVLGLYLFNNSPTESWIMQPTTATPPPPSGLTAVRVNGVVSAKWAGSGGATSYNLKRSTTSGSGYAIIASTATTAYVDSSVANDGTVYYYVVSAVNAMGESANSLEFSTRVASGGTATASSEYANAGQTADKAFDGVVATKWFDPNQSAGWLQYQFAPGVTQVVAQYQLTSAEDVPQRDPAAWQFLGSNDGTTWTTLDTQTGQTFSGRNVTNTYTVADPAAYAYYRLNITANLGGAGFTQIQLSELTFLVSSGIVIPSIPANLTAAASSGQVALGWSTSYGATTYNVKGAIASGGPYATIASPATPGYTDTGLTNGTIYYYVVSAVNSVGESANSAQASATAGPVPSAPTGVTATPGNGFVNVAWTAPSGASSYTVSRSTTNGSGYTVIATNVTSAAYTDTNVVDGTTYYYVVTASDASGTSAASGSAAGEPVAPLPPPVGLTISNGDVAFKLTWTAWMSATGYNVKRATANGGPYTTIAGNVASASYTDSSITNGSTYYYVVTALNPGGESGPSAGAAGTANFQLPAVPANVAANGGNATVSLTWNVANGASSYNVRRSLSSGSGYSVVATNVTSASYTDSGLTNGTTYYYTISSKNGVGESATSTAVSASPFVPAAPTGCAATAGNTLVSLAWTAASKAVGYTVSRSTTSGGPYTAVLTKAPGTTYVDTGLTNGTKYYYTVTAVFGNGATVAAPQISGTPSSSTTFLRRTSGGTSSASSGTSANAFDQNTSTTWLTTAAAPGYVQYLFGNGASWAVTQYQIRSGSTLTILNAPKNWTLQASNDNASWTTLDTQTNQTFTSNQTKTYNFTNSLPYRYYRLAVSAVNGGTAIQLSELSFYSTPTDAGDKTAPVVTPPVNIVTPATSPLGATLTYTEGTATDVVAGALTPTYAPVSGASLPLGQTLVQCSATDLAGNTGSASFTVRVMFPVTTALTATPGSGQVALNWANNPAATNYNLKRSTTSGTGYTTITGGLDSLGYTDGNIVDGVTYYYVVTGLDGGVESGPSAEVSVTVMTPYEKWERSNGISLGTPMTAAPDGDGLSLLLKYATATPVGVPSANPAVLGEANGCLTLSFNSLNPATVNYAVEASTDLVTWTPIASLASGATSWAGPAGVTETGPGGTLLVTVTDSVAEASTPQRFLRLRVTAP